MLANCLCTEVGKKKWSTSLVVGALHSRSQCLVNQFPQILEIWTPINVTCIRKLTIKGINYASAKTRNIQGCHIWVGPKFPDISLTIPWHITFFPWQFTLFFQVKNKDDLQKQWKILVSTSAVLAINQLM